MTMTHYTWLNLLIIVSIIGAAEEVVRRLVGKPVARAWGKVERFLDTWNGEPERDGLPARPGLVNRVIAIEVTQREQLTLAQSMHHELHPNSGASLRDAVDRIESASEVAAKKATKAAEMAESAAEMATSTKAALDEHVEQSKVIVEQGAADKAALWLEAERHTRTVTELAKAVQIAAQSTPPHEGDE